MIYDLNIWKIVKNKSKIFFAKLQNLILADTLICEQKIKQDVKFSNFVETDWLVCFFLVSRCLFSTSGTFCSFLVSFMC